MLYQISGVQRMRAGKKLWSMIHVRFIAVALVFVLGNFKSSWYMI